MALDTLSRIHKRDLSSLYVNGVVKKWSEDQYSHGAFALFTPTQERDLFEYLYQRQGNILFAGEHTTLKHAWVEGAMISALRSVVQITHDSYDIAIVGGGPIGLAAALFCAKQGKSVVVLERFTFKNRNGSSNGATRQFREMYAEKLLAEFATDAVKFWKDLEEWSGKKLLYQDGYLFFGNTSTGKTTEGDFNSIKKCVKNYNLIVSHKQFSVGVGISLQKYSSGLDRFVSESLGANRRPADIGGIDTTGRRERRGSRG